MALYVATDGSLEPMPFDGGTTVFCIQGLSEHEQVVRSKFTRHHVAYLGAHTGCSCGFAYGRPEPMSPEQEQEERMGRDSVAALRGFLEAQLALASGVELFSCWEGEQALSVEAVVEATPAFFDGDTFELDRRVFYRVSRAA